MCFARSYKIDFTTLQASAKQANAQQVCQHKQQMTMHIMSAVKQVKFFPTCQLKEQDYSAPDTILSCGILIWQPSHLLTLLLWAYYARHHQEQPSRVKNEQHQQAMNVLLLNGFPSCLLNYTAGELTEVAVANFGWKLGFLLHVRYTYYMSLFSSSVDQLVGPLVCHM